MQRRVFIKASCICSAGIMAGGLTSCGSIHYATATKDANQLIVLKSEFWQIKKEKKTERSFVLIKKEEMEFPICLYKKEEDLYLASLMCCTHRRCELNLGGNTYTCPCHGSEFSTSGEVLTGPATLNLKTFKTKTDHENIYIFL